VQPADRSAQSRVFVSSLNVEPLCSQKQDSPSTQEHHRTKFYEIYRREAEDYDREFIKRYDEDLNTTLIFVCLCVPRVYGTLTAYRPVCSPL